MKKRINFILRLFLSFAIIFALLRLVPYKDLITQLKEVKPFLLASGFGIFFLMHLVGVLRWKLSLLALGLRVKYKHLFFLFFSGLCLNLVFPSLFAQDIFRGGLLGLKEKDSYEKIAASLVIDRFSGLLALGCVAIVSFLLGGSLINEPSLRLAMLILFLAVSFISLFIFSKIFFHRLSFIFSRFPSFKQKLESFHNQLYVFRKKPFSFLKVFIAALLIQFSTPVGFYLVGLSFGVKLAPIIFFILVPVIMVVATLPITIAGLGTREAMAVYFFSKVGVAKSLALGISLMNFFFFLILSLFGAVLYLTFYSRGAQSYDTV